jgi:hypothetical protein
MTAPVADFIVERDDNLLGDAGAAWFSQDRRYRYLLTRRWGDPHRWMTFIMLNPSTADAFADDPTIRRCTEFAKREGCGGLDVVNLFAWRATDPRALRDCADPIGQHNHHFLAERTRGPFTYTVAAWGAGGALNGRGREVGRQLATAGVSSLLCLGITKGGHPKHPLARGRERVPDDAPLIPWELPS